MDSNEVHILGDMNIDLLDGKWLRTNYHLITLSRMLQSTCNSLNFSQIVQEPTRFQFNRVTNSVEKSLIDHIYTNHKFRCSSVSNITFGGSDHNLIGYVRYSADTLGIKSNTIRKRSYKEFDQEKFLADLRIVDWSLVYQSLDVDLAAHNLANLSCAHFS